MDKHTLYLARHGETSWNQQKRWQGQSDIPLNEVGRSQALRLAQSVRRLGIRCVHSSQLSRAKETAEIVATELGIPYNGYDARLAERCFGQFEGLTRAEVEHQHPREWRMYQQDRRRVPPGGESFEALIERLSAGLAEHLTQPPTLIVTHGGCMRSLWAAHDHHRKAGARSRGAANHMLQVPKINNCAVIKLEASVQAGGLDTHDISLVD